MAQKIISVFGSSQPKPGDPVYATAQALGEALAQAGYAVATGGYTGTMEAVSRGAREAGGHVIGITSDRVESYRPIPPNGWLVEEIKYGTAHERLVHLVTRNDGMIVLPGGVGTLAELSLAWSLMQVHELAPRPLILLGALWRDTLASLSRTAYVTDNTWALIAHVNTPQEAVQALTAYKG